MTQEDKDILKDFPVLKTGKYAYLDSAATTQKPVQVLDKVEDYYRTSNANPLRGLYKLSLLATDIYEEAREKAAAFIGAPDPHDIIFTRNATESLNLIAYSYGMNFIHEGDEIIVSIMEHHSNMLPWQNVAKKTGAKLIYVKCSKDGILRPEDLEALVSDRTRLVAITQISNVLGCLNDIKAMAAIAHKAGAVFVCDGAQSAPHIKVDVSDLDVDFFAFSGHKMLSPMGIGVLYGKHDLLDSMPPFLYGGEMIEYVTLEGATYAELPHKFEAGTVNAGGAAGLSAAIDYYNNIGFDTIIRREEDLTRYLMERISDVPHVSIFGDSDPANHHGIVTFKVDGVHPHDVAAIFDSYDVCVRAGHHCAQPLLKYLGTLSTTRASLAFYNTHDDIDRFIEALKKVRPEMGYED
ncbi:MAG: SufS family cysteine desulfurase [Lachnospiraceae bacterium]|nr:SufS family cysteine desulfurase [Lachnospiraceae bacterium]MEE3461128.1 SufS family cysteine desulfurase [Lachnospiraceae bacterium]